MRNLRTGGFSGKELKFFDSGLDATSVQCLPNLSDCMFDPLTINCLNCPEQGSAPQNREGRNIKMHSVHIEGTIHYVPQFNNTVIATIPDVFIALVLDTQTNKAQMNSGECFQNPQLDPTLKTAPLRNLEYTHRFRVLKTMRIRAPDLSLDITGASGHEYSGKYIHFEIHKKLYGLITNFAGNASPNTVGNIVDNSLHIIAMSDGDDTLTSHIEVDLAYNARIRFYE